MKNILDYIPGFRTRKIWKMIVAALYYLSCIITFFTNPAAAIGCISFPLIVFGIANIVKKRGFKMLIVGIVCFIIGLVLPSGSSDTTDSEPTLAPVGTYTSMPTASPTTIPTASPTAEPTAEPTPEPTPIPTPEPTPIPTPVPTMEPTPVPTPVPTAVPTPVPTVKQAASSSDSDDIVWVGETGDKYHYENCRTLRGNKYSMTKSEAIAQGRTSCGVCHR